VPKTIDAALEQMRRYIENPPVRTRVTVTFDAVTGVPTRYHVQNLEFEDSDEGFWISHFERTK
jgi:hypothetical protein